MDLASEKRLKGVKPNLIKVVRRADEITTQPFRVVQGNRTLAEQKRLYAQGRTRPGPKVTWTLNSRHIGGNAIDFAALVRGQISWNAKYYPAVVKAFKQASKELKIPIIAGADWKARDWGHIQLA